MSLNNEKFSNGIIINNPQNNQIISSINIRNRSNNENSTNEENLSIKFKHESEFMKLFYFIKNYHKNTKYYSNNICIFVERIEMMNY